LSFPVAVLIASEVVSGGSIQLTGTVINHTLGNVLILEVCRFQDYVSFDMDFPSNWIRSLCVIHLWTYAKYACSMYVCLCIYTRFSIM